MYRNHPSENHFSLPTTNSASVHNSYNRSSRGVNTRETVRSTPGRYQLPTNDNNLSRRSSSNIVTTLDSNLDTVRTLRERLLTDIRQNMHEIDRELISMGQLPRIPRRMPARLSIMDKKSILPYQDDQMCIQKSKKVYAIMPRITSETKSKSNQLVVYSHRRRYHYPPEIEENVIDENEKLLSKVELMTATLLPANTYEILSTKDFVKIHSDFPTERALISVVQFADGNNLDPDDCTVDIPEQIPTTEYKLTPSSISDTEDLVAIDQVIVQDFQTLIQTAPEFKQFESSSTITLSEPAPPIVAVDEESANKTEVDFVSTIGSKPLKKILQLIDIDTPSQEESLPSNDPIETNEEPLITREDYFFSGFDNEGDGEDALTSFHSNHLDLPTESEILPESFVEKQPIRTEETTPKRTIILFSIDSFFSSVPD